MFVDRVISKLLWKTKRQRKKTSKWVVWGWRWGWSSSIFLLRSPKMNDRNSWHKHALNIKRHWNKLRSLKSVLIRTVTSFSISKSLAHSFVHPHTHDMSTSERMLRLKRCARAIPLKQVIYVHHSDHFSTRYPFRDIHGIEKQDASQCRVTVELHGKIERCLFLSTNNVQLSMFRTPRLFAWSVHPNMMFTSIWNHQHRSNTICNFKTAEQDFAIFLHCASLTEIFL